eukprot:9261767-Ditylum_brightwellii.AAC.1
MPPIPEEGDGEGEEYIPSFIVPKPSNNIKEVCDPFDLDPESCREICQAGSCCLEPKESQESCYT